MLLKESAPWSWLVGLVWFGLVWFGLGWVGLVWFGLGWVGLEWVGRSVSWVGWLVGWSVGVGYIPFSSLSLSLSLSAYWSSPADIVQPVITQCRA